MIASVYKCRLCGKEFEEKMDDGFAGIQGIIKTESYRITVHKCENGDCGVADLLGCRKIKYYEE